MTCVVRILQTDNRTHVPYVRLSQQVNKKACDLLGYSYHFQPLVIPEEHGPAGMHPACAKIKIVHDFMRRECTKGDVVVFLDSDAWVHNPGWLHDVICALRGDPTKHGCFSRDPYESHNTYINSGSFVLKVTDFTLDMYEHIERVKMAENTHYYNHWPFDQHYISEFVHNERHRFIVFKPEVMNTPDGAVIKHNWFKNHQMYSDLQSILATSSFPSSDRAFNISNNLDSAAYPNLP